MKRIIFKTISLLLIFTYIFNLCLHDLSFADDSGSAESPTSQEAPPPADSKSSDSPPPQTDADSGDSGNQYGAGGDGGGGGMPAIQITGVTGFNLGALQALQTDPFTGRANFSIPIVVPPGRKGIQPNLALTYSSGAGNGILGVGWALELGAIERSTKKGVPKYNSSDTFVFTSSGSSSELVNIGGQEYRAKIEGGFMKFIFDGSYWVVTDKTGTKYYFGQTYDTRQEDDSKVFKWCLDKVIDLQGNYLTLAYTKNENQIYPDKIEWTGNENQQLQPIFKVEFGFVGRWRDRLVSYRTGFRVVTNGILQEIRVKFQEQQIRKYRINYTYSESYQSLINSITQYGQDDSTTLPPITFEYYPQLPGWILTDKRLPDSMEFKSYTRIYDVNNDGFPDLIKSFMTDHENRATFLGRPDLTWQETGSWQLPVRFGDHAEEWRDDGVQVVDVNGDGWVDVIQHMHSDNHGCEKKNIYINNKVNGWDHSVAWTNALPEEVFFITAHRNVPWEYREHMGWAALDLNGDGLTDFIQNKYGDIGERSCYLNTGSGWSYTSAWIMPEGNIADGSVQFADLNGDGLVDFFIVQGSSSGGYQNTGKGWTQNYVFQINLGGISKESVQLADVNSDGLADIVVADGSTKRTFINVGDYSNPWREAPEFALSDGDLSNFSTRLSDAKGRLATDVLINNSPSENKIYLNKNNTLPNLLTKISNGLGGEVSITYKPSTQFDNTGGDGISDLSFPVYVVDTVRTRDNVNLNNTDIVTRYEYKNGLFEFYDREERRAFDREFRGFGDVKTIDNQGNFSETKFHQDGIKKGRPYWQETKDVPENPYPYTKQENEWRYTEPYSGVYFPYIFQTNNYVYDGDSSYQQTRTEFVEYDAYGNPVSVKSYGDVEINGDEKTQVTEYTYNTSNWILATPKHTYLLDHTGAKVSEKWFYYDNHSSIDDEPTQGQLTKEEAWLYNPLNQTERRISTKYTYDTYGNLNSATDALNHTTTTNYDTESFRLFPIKVTNALLQEAKTVYYGVNEPQQDPIVGFGLIGQVKSQEDPNGKKTYSIYDTLGRVTKVIGPNDTEDSPGVIYEYDLSSQPIKVTKKVKESVNVYLTTYQFFDGLGRVIESKSPAEDDPQTGQPRQIISDIVRYDSRGQVIEKYLPYFVEESPNFVTPTFETYHSSFTYDPVGRVIQTTNPDLTYSTVNYSDWVTTAIDENGHRKTQYQNAYGQIVKVEEYEGADGRSPNYPYQGYALYSTTLYEYDTLGNLTQITDNQGNITQITYDSLGRKLQMNDPDMGVWNYEYDDVGNLKNQTDAKAKIIEFNYDVLNRLKEKKVDSLTLATYIYDDPNKQNCIGRLSKIIDLSGSTEFFYDNLGREMKSTKTVNTLDYTVERTYDDLDRLVTIKYPDGSIVKYEYNPQGITKVTDITNQRDYVTNIDYSPTGQILKVQYGNGTETNYVYDPKTLRLTNLTTESPFMRIQDLSYQFDETGNIKQLDDFRNTATQSFKYDDLSRLIQAQGRYGTSHYEYDSIGNMTSKEGVILSYGKNGKLPHAVTQYGDTEIDYDDNGNMIKKGALEYTYDAENRLTEVEDKSTNQTQELKIGLKPGWNFFSLPIIPQDPKINSVLSAVTIEDTFTKLLTHADGSDGSTTITDETGKNIDNPENYDNYTKLMLHSNGSDGSNNFIDSATSKSVSAYGNAQLDTAQSKFGTASGLFDGNGDYLSLANSSDFDMGSGDFTIDFWVRKNGISAGELINLNNGGAGGAVGQRFFIEGNNLKVVLVDSNDVEMINTSIFMYDIPDLTWTHVAIVRSGNNIIGFKDGVKQRTIALAGNGTLKAYGGTTDIGKAGDHYFKGWLDEFRVSKGIARWASDFTPPPGPYGDQVNLDTAQKKFGSASALFDGNGDYLSLADSDDWNFGSGDFTIDFWVMFNSVATSQGFYGQRQDDIGACWGWFWDKDVNKLKFEAFNNSARGYFYVDWIPSINTWYHLAFVRNGNNAYVFINGNSQSVAVIYPWNTQSNITGNLNIGYEPDKRYYLNGWLDEFRISKGIARWTANFTPPQEPYSLEEPINEPVSDQVSRYNATTDAFEHYVGIPKFNQFDSFEYGKGYQVYITYPQEVILTVQGLVPEGPVPVELKSGYNLIPCPKVKETAVEQALSPLKLDIDYSQVYHYNKILALFEKYDAQVQEFSTLKPGESYYLYCLQDTIWQVSPTQPTVEFAYDGDGGRVKKTVGSSSTTYIGSLFEIDSSGKTTKYIFAGANRIASVESTGNTSYYHSDHLGSSNIITDSTGAQVGLTEFTPYGSVSKQTGSYDPKHKFTGKELDETGLYFYGARYYDPELGRFITADSIVQAPYDPQSLNRYSYCRNNPINLVDPTGHSWKRFWKSFAGAFLGALITVITGGLGAPLWLAGMAGGFFGGALTGGLEGGWRGALIGGALGGALGAFGGWGVGEFGKGFGYGMLVAGAGVAGATNSWDAFAGGVVGGIAGYAVGSGIDSYFHDPLSTTTSTVNDPTGQKSPDKNWRMLGIGTTDDKAQTAADATYSRVFYTRSRGIFSDLVRAGMQKVFGNSLASRQFAGYLRGAVGINIYTHSEGTLTLAGAIKALNAEGIKVQRLHIDFNGPAIARSTAANLSQSIGATYEYHLNWADPVGIFTTWNPVQQTIYGVSGTITFTHFHSTESYP